MTGQEWIVAIIVVAAFASLGIRFFRGTIAPALWRWLARNGRFKQASWVQRQAAKSGGCSACPACGPTSPRRR